MKRVLIVLVFVFGTITSILAQGEVIYKVDGMDEVTVKNIAYRTVDDGSLTMDVYYPLAVGTMEAHPVVILVNGFRDSRMTQLFGTALKDSIIQTSWARLLAASGAVAIAYESENPDDLSILVEYVQENADTLEVDGSRIGLFAVSSNPPVAISYANQPNRDHIRVAVYYYGSMYTPDGEFTSAIDSECRQYGCYGPSEVEPLEAFRGDLPTLVVRTGHDNGENPLIDHFVAQAIDNEVPLTFINFPTGQHGFDYTANQLRLAEAQEIVKFTIDYLLRHLMSG